MLRKVVLIWSVLWSGVAQADWSITAVGSGAVPHISAYGFAADALHTLSIYCDKGIPSVAADGDDPAVGVPNLQEITLIVDGRDFTMTARHAPQEGQWTARAGPALVEALKEGKRATFAPRSNTTHSYSLLGSGTTITKVLEGCVLPSVAQPGPVDAGEPLPVLVIRTYRPASTDPSLTDTPQKHLPQASQMPPTSQPHKSPADPASSRSGEEES